MTSDKRGFAITYRSSIITYKTKIDKATGDR